MKNLFFYFKYFFAQNSLRHKLKFCIILIWYKKQLILKSIRFSNWSMITHRELNEQKQPLLSFLAYNQQTKYICENYWWCFFIAKDLPRSFRGKCFCLHISLGQCQPVSFKAFCGSRVINMLSTFQKWLMRKSSLPYAILWWTMNVCQVWSFVLIMLTFSI